MCEFNAMLFDELTPLYPDSDISTGVEEIIIDVANLTYAGAHILINNLTIGQFVSFEAIGINHSYKFFELVPVPVEYNTGADMFTEMFDGVENKNVIRKAPFTIYDVEKPINNIINPTSSTIAVCFRWKANLPTSQKLEYILKISHLGKTKELRVKINVYNSKVEPASKNDFKYVNWLYYDYLEKYHNVTPWSDGWKMVVSRYFDMLHYGRQNMVTIWPSNIFDVVSGEVQLNEDKLDFFVKTATAKGLYYIHCAPLANRVHDGNDVLPDLATISINGDPIPGKGEITLDRMTKQIGEYFTKHNYLDRYMQSFLDEPTDNIAQTYKLGTDIIRKNIMGVRILEATFSREAIKGCCDIWCPTINQYERNKDTFAQWVKEGEGLFVYTCLIPGGNFCNRQTDFEKLRQVYLGWGCAKYDDIEGFLHWGGNFYHHTDIYENSCIIDYQGYADKPMMDFEAPYKRYWPAGDCAILYPGKFEPFATIRFEAHRIGLEDYALIKRLKKVNIGVADEIVKKLFRKFDDFEKNVSIYRLAKKELLQACDKYCC